MPELLILAANIAIVKLLAKAGADLKRMFVVDSRGILNMHREDLETLRLKNPEKYWLCRETNAEQRSGGIAEAMKGVDVVIAASTGGVIKREYIAQMAEDPIVFALSNPVPEIYPQEAKEAGARIVGTGRSDFRNQINNSLVFPGMFRGVLSVRARRITEELCITAAYTLARLADSRLSEDYIIPRMTEIHVFPEVATAVGMKAIDLGLARRFFTPDELYEHSARLIFGTHEKLRKLMELGYIS